MEEYFLYSTDCYLLSNHSIFEITVFFHLLSEELFRFQDLPPVTGE